MTSGNATNGQVLGTVGFKGTMDTNTVAFSGALIQSVAEANQSGSNDATRLEFHTKPPTLGPGSFPVERMRIDSNGKVGIGTTSPASKLHVSSGTLMVDGNANTGLQIFGSTFAVLSSGNVGVGATVPASKLHVLDGDIRVSTGIGQVSRGIIFQDGSVQTTAAAGGAGETNTFASSKTVLGVLTATNSVRSTGWTATPGGTGVGVELMYITPNSAGSLLAYDRDASRYKILDYYGSDHRFYTNQSSNISAILAGDGSLGLGAYPSDASARLHVSSASATSADTLLKVSSGTGVGQALFVVKGDGKVGVGTTVPASKLHVLDGDIRVSTSPSAASRGIIFQDGTIQMTAAVADTDTYTSSKTILGAVAVGAAEPGSGTLVVRSTSADDATPVVAVQNDAGAELMRLRRDGKLGLGTSSPQAKLHVSAAGGDLNISSNALLRVQTTGVNATRVLIGVNNASQTGQISVEDSLYRNLALAPFGGNVGVGTTAPSSTLEVSGGYIRVTEAESGAGTLRLGAAWAHPAVWNMNSAGTKDLLLGNESANNIRFYSDNSNEQMRINSVGNVGIGTTNPTAKLHVGGTPGVDGIRFPDGTLMTTAGAGSATNLANTVDAIINADSDANATGAVRLQTAAVDRLYITNDGNVGIGVNPSVKLHVHHAAGNVAQYITNDGANSSVLWFGNNFGGAARWSGIGMVGTDDALRFTGGNSSIADADTHMLISNSGNVGMGTTAPYARLHSRTAQGENAAFGSGQSAAAGLLVSAFNEAVESQVRGLSISAGGKGAASNLGWNFNLLGVNTYYDPTSDALKRYSTNGGFANTAAITMNADSSNQTGGSRMSFWTGSSADPSERLSILATGGVGIGTTTPVGLFTVGNGTMVVTASGKVGIGTTSPGATLETVGAIHSHDSGTAPDNAYQGLLRVTRAAGTGQYINIVRSGMFPWSIGTVYNSNNFAIGRGQATDSSFTAPGFVMDTDGNVGIGETTPKSRLDLGSGVLTVGSVSSSSTIRQDLATDDLIIASHRVADDSDIIFRTKGQYAEQTRMTIRGGGNVGIGTGEPGAPLTVQGGATSGGVVLINNDATTGLPNVLKLLQTDNGLRSDLKKGCVAMGLATGGSEFGGNFYVATQGVSQGSTGAPACDVGQDGTTGNVALAINTSNGHVGLGGAPNASRRLYVNGDVLVQSQFYDLTSNPQGGSGLCRNGTTGLHSECSSDRRLKKNIEPVVSRALAGVLKLRPVEFDWINGAGPRQSGFIAQEVKALFPLTVGGDEEKGHLTFSPGNLVPYLTRAIQEQQAELDALKARLEALERRFTGAEGR